MYYPMFNPSEFWHYREIRKGHICDEGVQGLTRDDEQPAPSKEQSVIPEDKPRKNKNDKNKKRKNRRERGESKRENVRFGRRNRDRGGKSDNLNSARRNRRNRDLLLDDDPLFNF